jgi:hypothetical protein
MNSEIEKLIELALVDGEVSEKERAIILRKAETLGFNHEEIELMLDAKLHQIKKKANEFKKDNINKCPACGERINGLTKTCICGYVFNTGNLNDTKSLEESIEILENLIVEVRGLSSSRSKEGIEFLIARVEKEIRFIKTRYSENIEVKKLISELEQISKKYIDLSINRLKRRKILISCITLLFLALVGYVVYKNISYKTKSEMFIEFVNSNYLDSYLSYKKSDQYKKDSSEFSNWFYESRFSTEYTNEIKKDSLYNQRQIWSDANNKSEFFFYVKAAEYFLKNDNINTRLCIDTGLVINPDFSPFYFRMSEISNSIDSTIILLSKAISLDSKNGYIYLPYRSKAYYKKGDLTNALSDINTYLKEYPKDRPIDIERILWKIAVLIDSGLEEEGCFEFNKFNLSQKNEIKTKSIDAFTSIINKCK